MVYIYKKVVGGKNQYYLRISERKGQRVIAKDIAYLGSSIEKVQGELDKLSKYKVEIRKAHKNITRVIESNIWLEKIKSQKIKQDEYLGSMLPQIEACKLHFNTVFQKKDAQTKSEIFKQFSIDFSYNTTSLEGNTIKLAEAQKLLVEGLTPVDKTMREINDVQNTSNIFLELDNYEISHESIIELHTQLMKNIDNRVGYRLDEIRVFKSNFDATPAKYVKSDMAILLKWYEDSKDVLHPLVLASLFHHKFEKIHPFMEGNGRTGRMLLNLILSLHDYPPVIVEKKLRSTYLDVLGKSDKEDLNAIDVVNYKDLVQFIAKELVASYWGIFL